MFSFEEHKDDLILVGGCRPQKRIIPPSDERETSEKTNNFKITGYINSIYKVG